MIELTDPRGILFLVVGPSGAGKDSLIEAARTMLRTSRGFCSRAV